MTEWVAYADHLKQASREMKENNDCTVFAWCNTFDAPYKNAHTWLRAHGRANRRGMGTRDIQKAFKDCKKATIKVGPYTEKNRITLGQFCKKHPTGRYYVLVRGHALCVKDGVIYDHSHSPRRQVVWAARVYLQGEL